MITRAHMRRQLRANGGITNARQGFGAGSWLKEKFRKLIPNELADIATKAAPFVAPFYPGAAAAMRGIGRFDKRGSISDAMKQAALTYGFGKGARYLGGADKSFSLMPGQGTTGGPSTYNLSDSPISRTWDRMMPKRQVTDITPTGNQGGTYGAKDDLFLGDEVIPGIDTLPTAGSDKLSLKGIMDKWQGLSPGLRTAIVGTGSGTLAGIAQWFENQIPKEQGESMEEYMARRKVVVGKLMRQYMDNTRAYEAEWTSMTDEEKNEEVANLNYNQGGRVGYQTGGITMANTLAQNIANNRAQQAAVNQQFQRARSRLPGYVAPERVMAPVPAPIRPPIEGPPPGIFPMPPGRPTPISPVPRDPDFIDDTVRKQPYVAPPVTDTMTPISELDKIREQVLREQENDPFEMRLREEERLRDQTMPVPRPPDFIDDTFKKQPVPSDLPVEDAIDYVGPADPDMRIGKPTPGPYRPPVGGLPYDPNATLRKAPIEMDTDRIDMTKPPGTPKFVDDSQLTVMPRYKDPIPQDQLMAGFAEWKRNNPDKVSNIGHAAMVPVTLPGGYEMTFPGGAEASNMAQYLESIGQHPYQRREISTKIAKLNQGGRVRYAIGSPEKQMEAGAPPIIYEGNMDPRAQAGLPSIPGPMRMARDGPEFDMRQRGGFQPLGRQEGKDDVPAMLAKNEFVMTADAVRAAGGGSINKGAQRMYDTMKKLERRVS